jgi:sporulation protein YlmC with PRC-barrel domain
MASQYSDRGIGRRVGFGRSYDDDCTQEPYFTTADSLIGDKVVNAKGDELGEIDAIMLDVQNGRIAYAVLSSGGFLGMGEKRFAIPWGALILDTENSVIVLDVERNALKEVLDLGKNSRPATSSGGLARIHR